jgi:hypothetical protein
VKLLFFIFVDLFDPILRITQLKRNTSNACVTQSEVLRLRIGLALICLEVQQQLPVPYVSLDLALGGGPARLGSCGG